MSRALDIPIRAEPVFAVIVVMCFATSALLVARIVFIVYGVEGKTFYLSAIDVAYGNIFRRCDSSNIHLVGPDCFA